MENLSPRAVLNELILAASPERKSPAITFDPFNIEKIDRSQDGKIEEIFLKKTLIYKMGRVAIFGNSVTGTGIEQDQSIEEVDWGVLFRPIRHEVAEAFRLGKENDINPLRFRVFELLTPSPELEPDTLASTGQIKLYIP